MFLVIITASGQLNSVVIEGGKMQTCNHFCVCFKKILEDFLFWKIFTL